MQGRERNSRISSARAAADESLGFGPSGGGRPAHLRLCGRAMRQGLSLASETPSVALPLAFFLGLDHVHPFISLDLILMRGIVDTMLFGFNFLSA